jgi:putative nucleotidyltransferase with HDIG domain
MIGETFDLKGAIIAIGRSAGNDIVLRDDKVSRQHCRIVKDSGVLVLEDLSSSNGSYVNGRAVVRGRLFDGDEIRLGNHVMSLSLSKDASDSDSVKVLAGGPQAGGTTVEVVVPEDTADFVGKSLTAEHSPDRMIRDLGIIYRVGNLINCVRNHDELLKTVLDLAFDAVTAERGFLVLVEQEGRLAVKARRFGRNYSNRSLSVSRAITEMVVERGQAALVNDALSDERFSNRDSVIINHLRSILCVPLKSKERVLGFIFLDNPFVTGAFSKDDLRLLTAIAIQAGVAIENSRLFTALEELMFGSIGALVAAVEAKDRYIRGHSERVARITRAIGEEMGLPYETMKVGHLAALLHDIGKIGISENILNNEGILTENEKAVVREHPGRGAEILNNIHDMADVAKVVRHHHEYYNGEGYPDGIAGKEIPIASRIISVADAYDAMTSDRPYRMKLTQETCLAEIVRCSGTQFDSQVVEALLTCIRKSRIINLAKAS